MVTADNIENKKFQTFNNRFYDIQEIDDYLVEIMESMDAMTDEINDLQQQLAAAQAKLNNAATQAVRPVAAPAKNSADDAAGIIAMAQEFKNQVISKAQADAKVILDKAQADADAQLKGLTDERDRLTREVNGLRLVASEYRTKFESLLQAQQEAIEKASELF